MAPFGVETKFVDAGDTDQFAQALDDKTRLIFVESIGNAKMEVSDLPAIAKVAHDAGIPLVVDSTIATPHLVKPGALGADIVVHSTSKFINGHGTAIGGAIIDTGNYDWANSPFDHINDMYDHPPCRNMVH